MLVDLAPVFLVRRAGWPLRYLSELAAPDLSDDHVGPGHRDWADYVKNYEATLLEQRRLLWGRTVLDERFRKALALANPDLASRASAAAFSEKRNKRARHLDTTLFRYLARASTRTEPCDMWASASLGAWGDATEIGTDRATLYVGVDLRPFQRLFRGLGKRAAYKRAGYWKMNPTFRAVEHDRLSLSVRDACGSCTERSFPNHPGFQLLLEAFHGREPMKWDGLRASLDELAHLEDDGDLLLELGTEAGVLVGGLDLPAHFTSSWAALVEPASSLAEEDRRRFWSAIRRLRRLARRLERAYAQMTAAEVLTSLETARGVVRALLESFGIGGDDLPRTVLRCDSGIAPEVRLGRELRERLTRIVDGYDTFESFLGLNAAVGQLHRQRLFVSGKMTMGDAAGSAPDNVEWDRRWNCWEAIVEQSGHASVDMESRTALWNSWLTKHGSSLTLPAPEPVRSFPTSPYGMVTLRFEGHEALLSGHGDEPIGLFARLWPMLARATPERWNTLRAWMTRVLARYAAARDCEFVELAAPLERAPNTLATPGLGLRRTTLWQASRGDVCLDGGSLVNDDAAIAPTCILPASRREVIFISTSSANITFTDPLAERLLGTSSRLLPSWTFFRQNVPFRGELSSTRASPELRLATGGVVCRRRAVLQGVELAHMRDASGPERYWRWQRWARSRGLGPLLLLRRPQEQSQAIHRDSPLALETAFEGLREAPGAILVEELGVAGLTRGADGEDHVTELAIPFERPFSEEPSRMDAVQFAPAAGRA
jgi:hypothetical protein